MLVYELATAVTFTPTVLDQAFELIAIVFAYPLLAAPTVFVYVFEYPNTVLVYALATALSFTLTVLAQAFELTAIVFAYPLAAAPTVSVYVLE